MSLPTRPRGFLLDMDGVLHVGDERIAGAAETLDFLRKQQIPFRVITNTSTKTAEQLLHKLDSLGLGVAESELFSVVTATREYLKALGNPRVHLLIDTALEASFAEFERSTSPDYIVLGDIGQRWNYALLNQVFNMLMRGAKLICMHRNKYWQESEGLRMDIGAFVAALEYSSGTEACVIGKPSADFFLAALKSLALSASEVAIVGDDVEADVGGAQKCGLMGILVKTGKYREALVQRSGVKADLLIDSIADLPGALMP